MKKNNHYPRGKLTSDDEGETALIVGVKDGVVILDFRKQLTWVGFYKEEAIALSEAIKHHAMTIPDTGKH